MLLGLLTITALAWTLRATAAVTLPIAAAFFVAAAVWPICTWVRKRVPDYLQWLGTVAVMLVVSALLLLFLLGMGLAAQQLLHRLPAGADEVRELVTGALYAGWLAAFGVDLLLVWALLALLLNFVPTIGSVIAGALSVIYVLATRDPGTALAAGAGILVIEQVMGNYGDPRLLGKQLAVSPPVLLAALLI